MLDNPFRLMGVLYEGPGTLHRAGVTGCILRRYDIWQRGTWTWLPQCGDGEG
jgi:hypothetical protein